MNEPAVASPAPASSAVPTPALQTRGLTRRFGSVTAVDGLDLVVEGPGVHGFLGPNGAGKSTTMKMVLGLIHPTAGEARVLGEVVRADDPSTRAHLGYLPQDPVFPGWMTGREYARHAARLCGFSSREVKERAEIVLERCGLEESARGRKIGGYSGGMKQRLGVAQALLGQPRVLFLDEPVSGLDPQGRADVFALIEELGQEATVFMSSHILADVERVCERLSVLKAGRLLYSGSTRALLQRAEVHVVEVVGREVAEGAVEALRAQAGVVEVAVEAQADEAGLPLTVLRARLADARALEGSLARWAVAHDVALVQVRPVRPTLEEVFLRLVGDDDGAGAPAAATAGRGAPS